MKAALLLGGLMLVLASPAEASWAENANKAYPVYTGTNAALARAQGTRYRHVRPVRRAYPGPSRTYNVYPSRSWNY
jgi:hypothetical protein